MKKCCGTLENGRKLFAEERAMTPRPEGYFTMRAALRVGVTTIVLTEGVWRTLASKEKKAE